MDNTELALECIRLSDEKVGEQGEFNARIALVYATQAVAYAILAGKDEKK